jgi:hypothetical protein
VAKSNIEPSKRSLKRTTARAAAVLAVIGIACAALAYLFGNLMLSLYARMKIEKAFAAAHPRQVLRIGQMHNSWKERRLSADSLLLTTPHLTFKTGPVAIHNVLLAPLLSRKPALAEAFAQARLEARDLVFEFSNPRYELRCARLEASLPAATLNAMSISLRPQAGDEAFFAADLYSQTRLRVVIPECRVAGLSYADFIAGKACRAQSMQVLSPELEALVNHDKPDDLTSPPAMMVHEALAALGQVIALDVFTLTSGTAKYCERLAPSGPLGVLTFGAVQLTAKGLDSRAPPGTAMSIQAETKLMDAGSLKLTMSLPVLSPDFSLSYSGSLGPMDMTRLNAFLEPVEGFRVNSCQVESVVFDVQVKAGHATGTVQPIYRNLDIALLDKDTGSAKGVVNRAESFLANTIKIRHSNLPDTSGAVRAAKVKYDRKPSDTFLQFIWFALRSGVLDGISN